MCDAHELRYLTDKLGLTDKMYNAVVRGDALEVLRELADTAPHIDKEELTIREDDAYGRGFAHGLQEAEGELQ